MTIPSRVRRIFHSSFTPWRPLALVVALLLALPAATQACSVPVFRYALEHWQPDTYVAVVFHRGELNGEQRMLVEQLDPKGDTGNSIANLIFRTVDLDNDPSETVLDLYEQHETDTLPLLSLQTSPKLGPPRTAWHGELSAENVAGLTASPTRQQISKRLLAGDSVVWVFLESGTKESDDAAFALLNEELARLQNVIELPPIEEQDLSELTVAPEELKIAFSTLRLSRENEQERPLIEMLLRVEPDLLDEPFVNQAMAFPIFGRGRALYALVGEGITTETIEDASRFLTGACQCTVKAQNPGVDLLMAVDWDQSVTPALPYDDSQPTLTGLTSLAAAVQAEGAAVSTDGRSATPPKQTSQPPADVAAATSAPAGGDPANDTSSPPDDDSTQVPPTASAPARSAHGTVSADSAGVQSLTRTITLTLGLIVAGVVLVTLIILFKWR
jgi:hypothetical protein